MKYRSYDKYTHSGIMWIDLVPKHWDIKKLKFIASCNDDVLGEDVDPDLSIRYVDIGSVSEGKILVSEDMSFSNAPSRARRLVRHGDIIISTVRTYLRAIAEINYPPKNMVVSTGFAVIRPQKIDRKYLAYALKSHSFVEWVVAESIGISYPAINASELMGLSIALPSREEQTAVATFLDHQTTQIDQLIEKKTRFIKLLKGKRAALVTEAVTGKFDVRTGRPYAEYKDSGVEWLGELPAHWEVRRLKYVASCNDDVLNEESDPDRLIRYVDIGNVSEGWVQDLEEFAFQNAPSRARRLVKDGDIIVSTVRTYLRAIAVIQDPPEEMVVSTGFAVVRPREINGNFLAQALKSNTFVEWVVAESKGISYPAINASELMGLSIALPPPEEQAAIAAFLDEKTIQIDQLIEKTQKIINLLKEKRAALITAAVTGKIDVRDWNKEAA